MSLFFIISLFCKTAYADLTLCAKAESEIDPIVALFEKKKQCIDGLNEFYRHFQKYGLSCDDGGLAEYYSGFAINILGDSRQCFQKALGFMRKDPQFRAFVIRHIDETSSREEHQRVRKNAHQACPPQDKKICLEIVRNTIQK